MSEKFGALGKAYEDQLPKPATIDLFWVISAFASVVTIAIPFLAYFSDAIGADQTLVENTNALVILILLMLSIAYIFYREISLRHRFSEYIIYSHYINHIFRDFVHAKDNSIMMDDIIGDICDKTADIFSITCGKKCYCVVKAFVPETTNVYEVFGDRLSIKNGLDGVVKDASLWTSLSSIIQEKTPRYYMCDDIIKAHRLHRYRNPKIKDYELDAHSWSGRNWPLRFRSTIVVPIRYINVKEGLSNARYFGFLCIDCNSRRAFDPRYHPELAAAIADLMFVILSTGKENNPRINL